MCIVAAPQRLASAAVVFFGHHGDISHQAQLRHVSRQCLYREAHSVLRDLDDSHLRQELARLQQQVADLQTQVSKLQAQRPFRVLIDTDKQAEFASTAQAEGVSLPVAPPSLRRLSFSASARPASPPWVASPSRPVSAPGLLLEVLDQQARPHVRQAAADEIFFGSKPVLMVVEPQSLCWLSGRLSTSRDGAAWASEFRQLPALEHVARDGGTGLANGLARVNPRSVRRTTSRSSATSSITFTRCGKAVASCGKPKAGPSGPGRLPRKPTRKWLNKTARVKH